MNQPTLVVLAAGLSTRYGNETGPKQIDPIGPSGEVIMDYSVYDALRAGFGRVVFVIKREMKEAFHQAIGAPIARHMEVAYAYQEFSDIPPGFSVPEGRIKPWGTGHAAWAARQVVDTPFAVVSADDFFGPGTFQALAQYLEKVDTESGDFAMVGFTVENTVTPHGRVSRGVCTMENGYLTSVVERTHITLRADGQAQYSLDDGVSYTNIIPRGTPVSMNVWAFTPRIFAALEQGMAEMLQNIKDPLMDELFLPAEVDKAIKSGQATVKVLETPERWYGVTWKEDRPFVESAIREMIDRGIYPEKLWD